MRTTTDGSLSSWPLRVFRPWVVGSAGGASLGVLLLSVSPAPIAEENGYVEFAPRAAVYDQPSSAGSVPDPFAPATSLSGPKADCSLPAGDAVPAAVEPAGTP